MINKKENYAEWTLLAEELNEAREHLSEIVAKMIASNNYDDSEFSVDLGHVYAHLNRVWNSRNQTSEITEEQREKFSQFPIDLQPVG
jgi:hypothetical protein